MRLVTMLTPGLRIPRVVMHWCAASMTTPTTARLQHLLQGIRDLRRQRLLDLHPLGEHLDKARQLGNPGDAACRQVPDMRLAQDGNDVVLAVRFEADVAQDDHLVVGGGLLERRRKQRDRIFVVSGEELLIGPHHAPGRACEAFAVGVVARPFDQRPHRRFRLRPAGPSAPARAGEH